MQLSRDAKEALELHFAMDELEAVLELETGLDANWGQTIFALHASGCWALTRSSYSDPYVKILMDPALPFTIRERQFEDTLTATAADGRVFPLKLYLKDLEAARAFADAFGQRAASLPVPAPSPAPGKKAGKGAKPSAAPRAAAPVGVSGLDPNVQILHDPMDPIDAAGNSMRNFFERVITRIGDAPESDAETRKTEKLVDPPSPEFISLVDTGDVFAKMPSKLAQAADAYMAAWERRRDPPVALKLAALYERKLDPESQRIWLERAVELLPPGKDRNKAAAQLIALLQKQGAPADTIALWQSKIV